RWAEEKGDSGCRGGRALSAHRAISRSTRPLAGAWKRSGRAELISTVVGFEVVVLRLPCVAGHRDGLVAKVLNLVDATGLDEKPPSRAVVGKLGAAHPTRDPNSCREQRIFGYSPALISTCSAAQISALRWHMNGSSLPPGTRS